MTSNAKLNYLIGRQDSLEHLVRRLTVLLSDKHPEYASRIDIMISDWRAVNQMLNNTYLSNSDDD